MKRLGPAGLLAIGALVLPPLGSILLFAYIETIGAWLRGHESEGPIIYAAGFAVMAGLALLPTYASAILGGWAFGFAVGFPAALAGFAGGSLIGYGICRLGSGDRVERLIAERPAWQAVRDALVGSGLWRTLLIVTLVRVPPNSPFALTNLVLASVKVHWLPYTLGTLVGMAPRTGIVLWLAVQIREKIIAQGGGGTAGEVAKQGPPTWFIIAGAVVAIAVLVVIGKIASAAVKRVTAGAKAPPVIAP